MQCRKLPVNLHSLKDSPSMREGVRVSKVIISDQNLFTQAEWHGAGTMVYTHVSKTFPGVFGHS